MGLFGNLLSSSSKTSSPTTTTVNNNQVAVSGGGTAFGATTLMASGQKSIVAGGNIITGGAVKLKVAKNATVNYSQVFNTPDNNTQLAEFAIAQNAGLVANFQSLLSQGMAAITPASAPSPILFGNGGGALAIPAANSAGDSQVITGSGNQAPASLTPIEWVTIIGLGVGVVALFLHAKH